VGVHIWQDPDSALVCQSKLGEYMPPVLTGQFRIETDQRRFESTRGSQMNASSIESRSLHIGKWGNLFMAASGVVTAYLSRSDTILIDGLFSGVNFVSAVIAAKVGAIVLLPRDCDHPWGYEAYEALYVMFRSLVLVGATVFASFGAVAKILAYSFGEEIPELVLGPIVIYTIAMSVICFGLVAWHRSNWIKSGKQSDVLKIESKASLIDGCISAGAGAALMGTVLLKGTRIDFVLLVTARQVA
jgi:predicted Co/Zn/Cd cation transporter (cation efflux family)